MAHITYHIQDSVATITIDNVAKANCLTMDMVHQLAECFHTLRCQKDLHAIVITGAGSRFFCAGADIREWGALSPDDMSRRWIRQGHAVFDVVRTCDIPTIAVVNGHAFGGGLELALMCDYRLAVRDADFALPEAMVGTIPGWLACEQLAKLTSIGVAKQLILFGEKMSAETAQSHGIVSKVCCADTMSDTLDGILDTLKTRSPYIASVGKRLIQASYGMDTHNVLHEFAVYMTGASDAGTEGKTAFLEKRPPVFSE